MKKKTPKFNGVFLDYLELIKNKPENVMLAHKRLYETVKSFGVETSDVGGENYRDFFNGEKIRKYDYFSKEFFGMESVINKLMRFMKSAAFKGEESRQVLLLMGPVGAGKSAGCKTIFLKKKYNIMDLTRIKPDYTVNSLKQLTKIIPL